MKRKLKDRTYYQSLFSTRDSSPEKRDRIYRDMCLMLSDLFDEGAYTAKQTRTTIYQGGKVKDVTIKTEVTLFEDSLTLKRVMENAVQSELDKDGYRGIDVRYLSDWKETKHFTYAGLEKKIESRELQLSAPYNYDCIDYYCDCMRKAFKDYVMRARKERGTYDKHKNQF